MRRLLKSPQKPERYGNTTPTPSAAVIWFPNLQQPTFLLFLGGRGSIQSLLVKNERADASLSSGFGLQEGEKLAAL